jgi:KaiC/GvpD/RAD55 family RecA-like ATPase
MSNQFPLTDDHRRDLSTNILDDLEGAFRPLRDGSSVLQTWSELDVMLPYGGIPIGVGHIVYILGRSCSGKTYLALNLVKKAIDQKYNVLYISLEMSKSQIYGRLAQLYSGDSFKTIIGKVRDHGNYMSTLRDLFERNGIHKHLKITYSMGVPDHIESLVESVKPDILVVDYIQIGPNVEKTKLESIDKLCRQFVTVKSRYNTTVVGLTQASRMVSADKNPKRYYCIPPDVDECKGSSEIENSADVILSIARPGGWIDCPPIDRNKVIVFGAKFRDQPDPDIIVKPIVLTAQRHGVLSDW